MSLIFRDFKYGTRSLCVHIREILGKQAQITLESIESQYIYNRCFSKSSDLQYYSPMFSSLMQHIFPSTSLVCVLCFCTNNQQQYSPLVRYLPVAGPYNDNKQQPTLDMYVFLGFCAKNPTHTSLAKILDNPRLNLSQIMNNNQWFPNQLQYKLQYDRIPPRDVLNNKKYSAEYSTFEQRSFKDFSRHLLQTLVQHNIMEEVIY